MSVHSFHSGNTLIKGPYHQFRGELGGTQLPDGYCLWLKFSVEAQKLKSEYSGIRNTGFMLIFDCPRIAVPRTGQDGNTLGEQNRKLGQTWKALSTNQKRVFHPWVFYTLSGLPAPTSNIDTDDEERGHIELSAEDRMELQSLYDNAVCPSKVRQVYAKASSGITEGRTVPEYNRLSLKCVERLHKQVLFFY